MATLTIAEATPQRLAALMVGREVELARRVERERSAFGDVVLQVERLSAEGDRGEAALREVSFSIRAGEILAVAGVAGNGQRELAETITGMRSATGGELRVAVPSACSCRRSARGDPRRRSRTSPRTGSAPASPPSLSIASNSSSSPIGAARSSRGPLLHRRGSASVRAS